MTKQAKEKKAVELDGVPVFCAHTEVADIDSLTPNPHNPNVHPPEQIEMLAKIIKHQGWRNPIVVSNLSGFITKGHGRLEAAKLNGWTQVPIDRQDYANEAAEYADILADNKIAELSHRDNEKEKFIFQEKILSDQNFDSALTGYQQSDIDSLLNGWQSDVGAIDAIEPTDDPAPGKIVIKCLQEDEDEIREQLQVFFKQYSFANVVVE